MPVSQINESSDDANGSKSMNLVPSDLKEINNEIKENSKEPNSGKGQNDKVTKGML